jgi:peptidoglycan/xylan/chitin deacetylase (PgdA/CDA1 family)
VRELHQRGHLVGSHSASHPACISALPRPRIEDEWRRSTCVLSEILRVPVETASVPGGFYSPAVAEAAGAAGVKCLFTSEPRGTPWRVGSCTTYGRYTLRSGDGSPVAVARAAGEPLACFGDWLSWNARKVAKRVGGRAYQAARERVFARSAG